MAPFGMLLVFVSIVVLFHTSELLFVYLYHRGSLSFRSALLSGPYLAMMAFTLTEFATESAWAPVVKLWPVSMLGSALCFGGELVRKSAMITAGRAFTHEIATQRTAGHDLIMHGIYRLSRHPGYAGWYWWAIGAQLVLSNPIAAVLAAVVAWRFFRQRIAYEESLLRSWFGAAYDEYCRRTPTRIPFIP
jgi:protein-S-isoprenylcysteine O-methyltransferase